jgi:periplasmic divalent cation tolerance protein
LSTFQDAETARTIGRTVVEEQLAACANIVPGVESTYWWKGIIETSNEVLAIFKTTAEQYPRLEARIKELHPYDVPEIVAIQPTGGLPAYLQWVAASCAQ